MNSRLNYGIEFLPDGFLRQERRGAGIQHRFGYVWIGLNGQPDHNSRGVFFQNPPGGFGPIPTRHVHVHNDDFGIRVPAN